MWALLMPGLLFLLPIGCATQGDFLRLEEKLDEQQLSSRSAPDPFLRIAKLSGHVDAMRQEIRDLKGALEVTRNDAAKALEAVSRFRMAAAEEANAEEASESETGVVGFDESNQTLGEGSLAMGLRKDPSEAKPDEELAGYRVALDAWRSDQYSDCIDQFTSFLQAYPTSGYADDAAYWLADCTFKNGEFKRAVVRFNAVVSVYPESPKAPDALYRQGESLLKLGSKFYKAAQTVFRRVQKDYPDSERSVEAAEQLKRLEAGQEFDLNEMERSVEKA